MLEIAQLIGPAVATGVSIVKELMKANADGKASKQQMDFSKRLVRLEMNSHIHALLLGRLLEEFKGNDMKTLDAITSVAAVYGIYTASFKQSMNDELTKIKGIKQVDIDKSVAEFEEMFKVEADRMTNIIKNATGVSS